MPPSLPAASGGYANRGELRPRRDLSGEQLPELVKGYQRVPQPLRTVERNGLTPSCLVSLLQTAGFRVDYQATEAFARAIHREFK